jgi:hypothetical protein
MAEAELGHEMGGHEGHHHMQGEHGMTRFAKLVGVGVSLTGVVLAVVGIASHRAHTAAVIDRTDANDQWAYYQSKKTLGYVAEATSNLETTLVADPARTQAVIERYGKDRQHYQQEAESIRHQAETKSQESEHEEARALLLDVSEGFLELGLVLSSLYFMAHRRFFPFIGGFSAVVGMGFAVWGFLS